MHYANRLLGSAAFVLCCFSSLCAGAVTPGQTDTFEDGTLQGWDSGSPNPTPPVNRNTGGLGAGNHYMLLTSIGGTGPGSKLTVFNTAQWAGNYLAAGIFTITMNVRNFGDADIALRLSFAAPGSLAISTDAIVLPVGSGWKAVTFPIDTGHLTALSGSTNAALTGVTEMRLYHNPSLGTAAAVGGNLGVDNIHATAPNAVAAVSGTVDLQGLAANAPNQNVTFTFRPADGTASFDRMAAIGQSKAFLFSDIPAKNYTLHVKADKYLAKNVAVDVSSQNVTGLSIALPAGDATNDNTVDIGDFGVLVNAYNGDSSIPNSGYNAAADFNGDGLVDIGDFGLLVNSYNLSGDM